MLKDFITFKTEAVILKMFSSIHNIFHFYFFFLSRRTLNYFEVSSGIKIRVTFKRFTRKSHINIPIVYCHCVNPLLYSFGAPLGFCWWIFRVYRLVQTFSCCQSNFVFMPGANYTRSSIKILGKRITHLIFWHVTCSWYTIDSEENLLQKNQVKKQVSFSFFLLFTNYTA